MIRLSSTPGCCARKAAMASGMRLAAADSKDARRSLPPRHPAIASSSASASPIRARIASAWRTSASPASVSRTPRALRCTSVHPASRSSAAICCEIADCVNDSDSAAALNEPRTATSRSTRRRRTSSISRAYSTAWKRSFELMAGNLHHESHVLPHRKEPTMSALSNLAPTVVIRAARGSDGPALRRLAELDSREIPAGDVLIAEAEDAVVAAVSVATGAHIADPFRRTADVVDLLEYRARRLRNS